MVWFFHPVGFLLNHPKKYHGVIWVAGSSSKFVWWIGKIQICVLSAYNSLNSIGLKSTNSFVQFSVFNFLS